MAEIILYGVIGDPADSLDAKTVTAQIRSATGPLSVRINSPGGYVMEGLAIYNAIAGYAGGAVTVYVDGLAASMGSIIAMAGGAIVMAESALMMVHKPWDVAMGDAPTLRQSADTLDKIEAQMVGIYAKKTGLPPAQISAMLSVETWMDPTEAHALGFATAIAAPLQIAAMADVSAFGFRHPPEKLKGHSMPDAPDTAAALTIERTRVSTIMALTEKHSLPSAMAQTMITNGTSLEAAREMMLDHLAARSEAQNIGNMFGGGHVTLDNPATYASAVTDALHAKISGKAPTGPAAEFAGLSVVDIARDFVSRGGQGGINVNRMSAERVLNVAMDTRHGGAARNWLSGSGARGDMGGASTTSDFPDLIGAASEKFLIERYKLQESALKQLASQRDLPNFLTHYGVQLSNMGALDVVNEGGEYKNRQLSTRKEGYALQTFGNMFTVTRQMLINDSLGALSGVINIMANAAAEMEANVLAGIINSNPNMGDGIPWFDARHGNLAAAPNAGATPPVLGGPPMIVTLDAGRQAMRGQKDLDGVQLIDANPKFLLVPTTLQTTAEVLVRSTIAPTSLDQVNPFAGQMVPIADPRLSSATAWFLFADPAFSPALQYSYLNGQSAPFLDQQLGWRVDGTEYKVRHDFGAGVLDYRMAWKNPGA